MSPSAGVCLLLNEYTIRLPLVENYCTRLYGDHRSQVGHDQEPGEWISSVDIENMAMIDAVKMQI